MSRLNNTNRDINKAIFSALKESECIMKEDYSEKFGGDPKDFIGDLISVKHQLDKLNLDVFGSTLARQMVEDFIETCDYQISKAKRLASGDEFYQESAQAEASMWEGDEPAPRKLTRDEWNKEFGAGADPEVINAGREPEDRVELVEDAPYRRYKVSFYVDTDEMNNIDIEERVDEVLKGSGLASADDSIDVEMIEEFED